MPPPPSCSHKALSIWPTPLPACRLRRAGRKLLSKVGASRPPAAVAMAAKCKNSLFYFLDVTCMPFGAGGARKAMVKPCSRRRRLASVPAGAAELADALLEQRAGEATGPTGVFAWGIGNRHKEKGWPRLRLSRTLQAKQQSDQSGAIPYVHAPATFQEASFGQGTEISYGC